MENYANKLAIIETYLQDQDEDINNIELLQSKTYAEVQDIRSELKKTTEVNTILLSINILLLLFILIFKLKRKE